MLKSASQLHFDQVDRDFPLQSRAHVGVSSDEVVDLLGSICPLGIWRLEIETGRVFWSDDAARIHGMEKSDGLPVSLNQILSVYHPEDAELVEQVVGAATTEQNSFRFVLRVKDGNSGYRLIATAGRFRADNGGELYGYCHEFNDLVRSIVLTGE
jgi:PAS domain-containing protein